MQSFKEIDQALRYNSDLVALIKTWKPQEIRDFFSEEAMSLVENSLSDTLQYKHAVEDMTNADKISSGEYILRSKRLFQKTRSSAVFNYSDLEMDDIDLIHNHWKDLIKVTMDHRRRNKVIQQSCSLPKPKVTTNTKRVRAESSTLCDLFD